MIRIILAALRAQPAQAIAIGLLAAVSAGLSAILPTYLVGAVESGTGGAVNSAPIAQRVVSVSKAAPAAEAEQSLAAATDEVRTAIERPGVRMRTGLRGTGRLAIPVSAATAGQTFNIDQLFLYRDGMCEHVRITGACPSGDHEIMLHADLAAAVGVDVGASLASTANERPPTPLTVVGIYQGADPDDPFWTGGNLIRSDPVLTMPATFRTMGVGELFASSEGLITPALFSSIEPKADADSLLAGLTSLQRSGYSVVSFVASLGDRVTNNRRLIVGGVPVAGVQVLLLSWFALGLAVRHSGASWRPDVGLLKLRGVTAGRVTALAVGRSAVPILAGAVIGAAVAIALIQPVKKHFRTGDATPRLAVAADLLPLGAVAAALLGVLGSLAVAAAAERRTLRVPVVDLLRRVPQRLAGWRAGAAEVVVAVLAVAALYQVRTVSADEPWTAGLALFVPVLVALTVALTGTRLLIPLAAVFGRRAFGGGRLSTGLAVIELARRPGARRLAALLVTATALLVTAATGSSSAATARADRAGLELGADRVLTVTATSSAHLLAAVRAADPGGRAAMAAVVGRADAEPNSPPALAVDTPRLAAVAAWPTGTGPGQGARPGDLAAQVRPAAGPAVSVRGGALELELTVLTDPSIGVEALLTDRHGVVVPVRLGPLALGRQTVRIDTPACVDGGCRLVSFALSGTRSGDAVVLHRLGQLDPPSTLVDPAAFADLGRWRQPVGARRPNLLVSRGTDGLSLRVDPLASEETGSGAGTVAARPEPLAVEVADAPHPLPAVASGDLTEYRRAGGRTMRLLGGTGITVRPAGTASVLPRVGATGLLVDLEYADRLLLGVDGIQQVWLARGAPAGIADRLRAEGLQITGEDSVDAATARYAAQGGAAVLRLYLVVAVTGLLLAAGSVLLVAAVDRPARAAELAALRVQGVPAAAVTRSVVAGYTAVVAVAVPLGVLAAVVAHRLAGEGLPLFDDRWELLARPGPSWPALALLAGALLGTLVPAVLLASRPRRQRGERG